MLNTKFGYENIFVWFGSGTVYEVCFESMWIIEREYTV